LILALAVCAGCTEPKKNDNDSLSRRERDSIIGESMLPGAAGVRGALRVADSAAARQERIGEIN
jgi:hypothetical protein